MLRRIALLTILLTGCYGPYFHHAGRELPITSIRMNSTAKVGADVPVSVEIFTIEKGSQYRLDAMVTRNQMVILRAYCSGLADDDFSSIQQYSATRSLDATISFIATGSYNVVASNSSIVEPYSLALFKKDGRAPDVATFSIIVQ